MLSKGRKKSYVCPACESPRIVNTRKGFTLRTDESWRYLPARHWLCLDCAAMHRWNTRRIIPALPDDIYTDEITVPDYLVMQGIIDIIQRYEFPKTTKPEVAHVEKKQKWTPPPPPSRVRGDITEAGVAWSPRGKEDLTHWTHRPDDFGVWVGYNSWRFKDLYNVMLKSGEIVTGCYPNASSFTPLISESKYGSLSEYDIIAVQLCTYEDIKDSHWVGGDSKEESDKYRAERNADMFGRPDMGTPDDWRHIVPHLFDLETKKVKPEFIVKPPRSLRGHIQSVLWFDDSGLLIERD